MALEFESHGYKILGILWRYQRKRKKKNGKKNGFYKRKSYAYVRVRMPNGKKRDFYLGRPDVAAVPQKRGGQAGPRARQAPAAPEGWRKGVEKASRADGDTRELVNGAPDERQRAMFESKNQLDDFFGAAREMGFRKAR